MLLKPCWAFLILALSYASALVIDVPTPHVVVQEGNDVTLPCTITSLGRNKMVWIGPRMNPLTYEARRVVDDVRFTVARNLPTDWNLVIEGAQLEDSGVYKCTVNTNPVMTKSVVLTVEAAPRILIDDQSPDKMTVKEGHNVTLYCKTSGVPKPQVNWSRIFEEEGDRTVEVDDWRNRECVYETTDNFNRMSSRYDNEREVSIGSGEFLNIVEVSRHCGGKYQCVAANNHPPAKDRTFDVLVDFAPEVSLLSTRISQSKGKETILQCNVQAYPHGTVYWTKDGTKLVNSAKHHIDAYSEESKAKMTLSVRFWITEDTDFGDYVCVAANEHGSHEASVRLLEYIIPTREPEVDEEEENENEANVDVEDVEDRSVESESINHIHPHGFADRKYQERSSSESHSPVGYKHDEYDDVGYNRYDGRMSSAASSYRDDHDYYAMDSSSLFRIPKVVVWVVAVSVIVFLAY